MRSFRHNSHYIFPQGYELEWGKLATDFSVFPFGLDYLMQLLDTYWQPLKLLSLISPMSLFSIMKGAKQAQFGNVLQKIVDMLSPSKNQMTLDLVWEYI